jgi:carbon-monoxide dehydrogenase small subunit
MHDISISFEINGVQRKAVVSPQDILLKLIREDLGLTGTKEGCGKGDCGACSVILNDKVICSCIFPAYRVDGHRIITVEGLDDSGYLHPLQTAFLETGAVQCGFCTPGMLIAAKNLLDRVKRPNEQQIKEAISGNLCRCTGYSKIVKAIRRASEEMFPLE